MARVLVAGELNADLVMTGLPSLPILGRELVGTGFRMTLGSSSAITAVRLATLGLPVDLVGWVGDDEMGRYVIQQLMTFGVGTQHIRTITGAATGVTLVLTYPRDRAMLTYPGVMAEFDGQEINHELLSGYTHLHVGSFFLQSALQAHLPAIFQLAHEGGLTTSLDCGWDPAEQWLANSNLHPTLAVTDWFFPNESEATALTDGKWQPLTLAEQVGGTLVIKRGAEGATATYPPSREIVDRPSLPVSVVDTTGAGDAFNAGYLYATLTSQADPLAFAVACGAQAVTEVGGTTNAPTATEIHEFIARSQ